MSRKTDWIEGRAHDGSKARAILWDGTSEQALAIKEAAKAKGVYVNEESPGGRLVMRWATGIEATPGQYLIDHGKGVLLPCSPKLLSTVFTPD